MTEEQVLTPERAREALVEDQARRAKVCGAELQALLTKHRCRLDWMETRRNGVVVDSGIRLVATD